MHENAGTIAEIAGARKNGNNSITVSEACLGRGFGAVRSVRPRARSVDIAQGRSPSETAEWEIDA